jgi:hypothetical protein
VEALPDIAPPAATVTQTFAAVKSATTDSAWAEGTGEHAADSARPRETRVYKGAIYEKGDDDKWHLQKN